MCPKSLSLVVPVFNLEALIEHLETELSKLRGSDVEIILVDDGSTDRTAQLLADLTRVWEDITLVTLTENRGAGVARNLGFPRATGTYTLFFDADDFLHPEAIFRTIEALDETGADASINAYDFIRDESTISTGMNATDDYLWKRRAALRAGGPFHISDCPDFLRFTNFPWNKLIRTSRYQERDLGPLFGETKVNNDIQGHWTILLHARGLIASDLKTVTHRVSGARDHLSNRFGGERLQLFSALQLLHEALKERADPQAQYRTEYWQFARQMTDWAHSRLDRKYEGEFQRMRHDLVARISFSEMHDLVKAGEEDTYHWVLNSTDWERVDAFDFGHNHMLQC